MLTVRSSVFACTREQAQLVAECANLVHRCTSLPFDNRNELYKAYKAAHPLPVQPKPDCDMADADWEAYDARVQAWNEKEREHSLPAVKRNDPQADYRNEYDFWEDRRTGGGGGRICWAGGVAWVSAHSGYAWADITDEIRELFAELGCKSASDMLRSPAMYGVSDWKQSLKWLEAEKNSLRDGD